MSSSMNAAAGSAAGETEASVQAGSLAESESTLDAGERASAADDAGETSTGPARTSRNYRRRARVAEGKLEAAERDLVSARQAIAEREATIEQLERRERVNALLIESETIDLPTARLLAEVEMAAMDEPDAEAAVAELQRTRPFLFRRRDRVNGRSGGVMSPAHEGQPTGEVEAAADEAFRTGRRGDVLRYLRLRRAVR